MDPFLEDAELWSEVHSRLIVAIADAIAPDLLPNYYVAIEKRTYLSTPEDNLLIGMRDVSVLSQPTAEAQPEEQAATATLARADEPQLVTVPMAEEVQERYLEIRETKTGQVVTAIELLSPTNKRAGEGREQYLRKRQQVLSSMTHLVKIDLIRGGVPIPIQGVRGRTDYRILISRAEQRPQAELYGFNVRDGMPVFAVPLEQDVAEPSLELKPLLDGVYERAGFGFRVAQRLTQLTP